MEQVASIALFGFIMLNSEFSSLYLQLPLRLFTGVLQADTLKVSEMSEISGIRSCCFSNLPLVLQRGVHGMEGKKEREHVFPYCLPLSLTPELDDCFL